MLSLGQQEQGRLAAVWVCGQDAGVGGGRRLEGAPAEQEATSSLAGSVIDGRMGMARLLCTAAQKWRGFPGASGVTLGFHGEACDGPWGQGPPTAPPRRR